MLAPGETIDGRVTFGPADGNSIPADWAQLLLWRLYEANPMAFGKQLMGLYGEKRLGQELTVSKRRGKASS